MKRGPALHPLTIELFKDTKSRTEMDFAKKTTTVQDGMRTGASPFEEPKVDIVGSEFLAPTVEEQLTTPGSSLTGRSIVEELTEDRMFRKIEPFTPGPIGAYKRRPVPRPYTIKDWRDPSLVRKEMLELRAKNDATLKSLEERL